MVRDRVEGESRKLICGREEGAVCRRQSATLGTDFHVDATFTFRKTGQRPLQTKETSLCEIMRLLYAGD